nr:spermidine synthase [Ipomoea batatas]
MAGESEAAAAVSGGELPVKRQREDGQNGESVSVEMEDANNNNNNAVAGDKEEQCFSSVIPGWFSEISPMWPVYFTWKLKAIFLKLQGSSLRVGGCESVMHRCFY